MSSRSSISKHTRSILPDPIQREAYWRGVRELLPAAPGVFAWGLVTGVAMVKSGLSIEYALIMTFLAYAGSAQLAALPLLITVAPLWVVALTAIAVNLRFVVYSAAMLPHLRHLPSSGRVGLGYLIGDIGFAKFSALLEREPNYPHRVAYFAGGASCNWVLWQASSVIGILAATTIPVEWGLALAGTLVLIPLLVPFCRDRPALAGVCVASVVAIVGHGWPLRLGLVAGIVAGMLTALSLERLLQRESAA